ncbi:hypothetical protein L7F22_056721 [Adiantum nelumboides]|nr:hypothetical protein [Adiantum nelumboides]
MKPWRIVVDEWTKERAALLKERDVMRQEINDLRVEVASLRDRSPCLLSESFEVLLDQVEKNLIEQACRTAEGQDAFEESMTDSAVHEPLWVEKYAPKSFTELLSDEQTNREVLRWLKQWDKCVFGATKTSTSLDVLEALKRHPPTFKSRQAVGREGITANNGVVGAASGSNGVQHNDNVTSRSINSMGSVASFGNRPLDDRPEEKILLLCGPPGLGNTTLAHVAARHCGYRVVEINASDDRVASTLQAKILDAVQMKSVMGDLRPNCVVIDEIDGALGGADGKGAIDALLKIAYAGVKELSGKVNEKDDGLAKKASTKKTLTTATLSRPVICICNDPYAPALRQLRQMAKVHVFTQPSVNRVVTRLKYICSLEDYKISARALTALADHTECDIRSCLNTLQFLRKKKESLNMLDVASQVVGRKDMTSSAFDVWGEILQKRKPKQGINIGSSKTSLGCSQEIKNFLRLHDLLANHGDFEITVDGVYDNLTHIRYQDSSLQKTVQCLELLGDSEITSCYALRHQNFTLNVYQPAFSLAIRRLVAQQEKPFMEWPKTFQRLRAEHSAKKDLLRSWMMSMQPLTYRNFTAECLAWDLVSPLLGILSPLRLWPVAPQLLSQSEKEELGELIDTMITYGINYRTSKFGIDFVSEAQGPVLYPPIFKLVQFKDYKMEHRLLSSTLRQVLGHEVSITELPQLIVPIRQNLFLGIFVTKMSLFLFYAAAAICKMPRMQDNLWTHVTRNSKYGGSGSGKWTCNFCGETQSGSATRLKAHFSHTWGFGISPCKQVPQDIFNGLKGWKAEQLGLPVEKVPTFKGGECEISRATMKRPRNVQEEVTQESVASAVVQDIKRIWNLRWDWFHRPIHAVAHILHPLWRKEAQYVNEELHDGWTEYIQKIVGDDVQLMKKLEDELLLYRNGSQWFGSPTASLRETQLEPVSWWEKYGIAAPNLRRIALRVLSQDCSSGPCERNWSTWALFHTKKRNKLSTQQLERLVFCHCNLKLLEQKSCPIEPRQVNPDKIDINKCKEIPDIPQEEQDIYAMLYEETLASAHNTRSQRRASTHTRTPTATNEDDEDFQDSDPASEEDDDEVLEDVVVEEVLADEEDILDDDEEA